MGNNAIVGFAFQKAICDIYNIKLISEEAKKQFDVVSDLELLDNLKPIIIEIFNELGVKPVECTTYKKNDKKQRIPYNFILSNGKTLSVRTSNSSGKVAPRVVGQAGYEKINENFKEIYGKDIVKKTDIKQLIMKKTDKVLPVFLDYLFDADFFVYIYKEKNQYKYYLVDDNAGANMVFRKKRITFSRKQKDWTESNSIKYDGKTIAEAQIHKKRTFKFRFSMKNIISLLANNKKTNETFGITAEKTICDLFGLSYPENLVKRSSLELQSQIMPTIVDAFGVKDKNDLPKPIRYTGSEKGSNGNNSKCPYDFVLWGDKTLSLKTNLGDMVCPPEIGQPNDKTCYHYFSDLVENDKMDEISFKKMVYKNTDKMIVRYLEHLFDSDYLLRIYVDKSGKHETYQYDIYPKNYGSEFKWEREKISFSKPVIEKWNESNTVYYAGIAIGEFQVHSKRNCFKFRFKMKNLDTVLNTNK